MYCLEFKNVSKRYHYSKFPVLTDLTFQVKKNQTVSLLVDEQSGKTTISKLILGIEKADSGEIFFEGKNLADSKNSEKNIAYLCKELLLFENKTVEWNLCYPLKIRKTDTPTQKQISTQSAQQFQLLDLLNTKVKKLTYEQKIKLVLARLTVRKVDLVLVDGLLDGLEGFLSKMVLDTLAKLSVAVLVLTSDLKTIVGDAKLISHGKVVCEGDLQNIKDFHQNLLWLYTSKEEKHGKQK